MGKICKYSTETTKSVSSRANNENIYIISLQRYLKKNNNNFRRF